MPTLTLRGGAPTVIRDAIPIPPGVPDLPDDVLKRFPSLAGWKEEVDGWYTKLAGAIGDNQHDVSQAVTKSNATDGDLRISIDENTVAITTETNARIAADGLIAQRIVTVSALTGTSSNITVAGSAPGAPAVNDLWVDNSDLATPVTYKWSGVAWVEVTEPISVAAVAAEQTARITADGYLSGKYTLTVIAGDVVTGMNITSSTGGGTNVSSVIFRATDFKIYNGTSGITMFEVSGATVNLAGTLTVSTSGKVFIGTGTYANANTAWYVDSTGQFSLKDKLTWDGTTLTITGSISATTGTIGGWDVGTTTISKNNAILDSAGQLVLGTVNDVVVLSATDATYRVWVGNATAGTATFSVTKAGALFSTSGTIGGFTIGTATLSAGTGIDYISFTSNAGSGITMGTAGATTRGVLNNSVADGTYYAMYDAGNFLQAYLQVKTDSALFLGCGSGAIGVNQGIYISGANAKILFGNGGILGDTNIYRFAANQLATDDDLIIGNATTRRNIYIAHSDGTGGQVVWGTGGGSYDASLYRGGVGVVETTGSLKTISGTDYFVMSSASLIFVNGGVTAGFIDHTGAAGAGRLTLSSAAGATTIQLDGATGLVSATTFSGSGASLTGMSSSQVGLGSVPNTDCTNASNISSGTLNNARLPSAVSVTSLSTTNFEASVITAVDVKDCNLRVMSGASPVLVLNRDLAALTINGSTVVQARSATVPTTLSDVITILQYHGLCST